MLETDRAARITTPVELWPSRRGEYTDLEWAQQMVDWHRPYAETPIACMEMAAEMNDWNLFTWTADVVSHYYYLPAEQKNRALTAGFRFMVSQGIFTSEAAKAIASTP